MTGLEPRMGLQAAAIPRTCPDPKDGPTDAEADAFPSEQSAELVFEARRTMVTQRRGH